MRAEISWLVRAWQEARRPLVITGAGISVASGLAPFRGDKDAVWSKTTTEMGTRRMFEADPVAQWRWYLSRFEQALEAAPNRAHTALAALAHQKATAGGQMGLITQNVDGLHRRAGSPDVIEIHGAARLVRCSQNGCANGAPTGTLPWDSALFDRFRVAGDRASLPQCPLCSALLRPHVLWFDERYAEHAGYRSAEVQPWLDTADLVMFVGTSFSVGLTETAMFKADLRQLPTWSIDPNRAPPAGHVFWLEEDAGAALTALADHP